MTTRTPERLLRLTAFSKRMKLLFASVMPCWHETSFGARTPHPITPRGRLPHAGAQRPNIGCVLAAPWQPPSRKDARQERRTGLLAASVAGRDGRWPPHHGRFACSRRGRSSSAAFSLANSSIT